MNFHNINTIARYEVKLLKRSWLFRIFAILALLGLSFYMLATQTLLLNTTAILWPKIAVSSLMPFCNVYFFNIAQSIIVIFLAGSFLKRDKKLDTAEVIYVRPMSNADYIIGKTWGIIKVFLSLNIISLVITGFLNLVINHSPFDVFPYAFYLFTISFPSLLFVLGLSFTMMCLLKNQAVTFIVMLGAVGMSFFYLKDLSFGVFDFFGVSIPTIFSDVTGHADLFAFLLQRLIYLLAGLAFISFTIALVNRLPHRPWKTKVVYFVGGMLLAGGVLAGWFYVFRYQSVDRVREGYAEVFNRYASERGVRILSHDLTVVPQGKQMEGKSSIRMVNPFPESLEKFVLYLNPGLKVSKVESNGKALSFKREKQVVVVDRPTEGKEEFTLTMDYEGTILESVCYTDVTEKEYWDYSNPLSFYRLGKRYAWLEDRFVLLTPETMWYPVAVAPVYPDSPYNLKKNFVDYRLTVVAPEGRSVLSQGAARQEGNRTVFTNSLPLPGISLTIADYEKKSVRVDSTDYALYYFNGHDYFSKYFDLIVDTLPRIIGDIKERTEVLRGRDYLFDKFVIAEVPVHFAAYVRNWKGYTEYVMPEIVFIPERGATLNSDFSAEKARSIQWRRHDENAPNEEEMGVRHFENFISSVFNEENVQYGWGWDGEKLINPYNINSMFFMHAGFIRSEEFPVLDLVVNMIQNNTQSSSFNRWGGVINDQQRANEYLESRSLRMALSDRELKPEILYELLKLKSGELRNYIYTQMPPEDFVVFLKEFFTRNYSTDISFETFKSELKEYSGVDLSDFITQWYDVAKSPSLLIRDVDANQLVLDELTQYQVKFKIYNSSDVDAIITAQILQGGESGGGRRGGMRAFNMSSDQMITETYVVPGNEAREIKVITAERPVNVMINTNISHNLPTVRTYNFSKVETVTQDTFAGSYVVSPSVFTEESNEIIVDNEDAGFKAIESNSRHKLKDLFQKPEEGKYKNFMPWFAPTKWTAIAADYCYGSIVNSAVYKRIGMGNNSVEWTAVLPRDGFYEVSVWNAKSGGMGMMFGGGRNRNRNERNQTYHLVHEQGKESITIDMNREDGGWVSFGSFYFMRGATTISLTDKGSSSYVIADAVRFTLME